MRAGHAAVEQHVLPFPPLQPAHHQLVHPHPLTEHHDLHLRVLENLLQQPGHFVGLHAVVSLLVQQVRAVARHPHVLQGDPHAKLVPLAEEVMTAPLRHQAGHDLAVLLVVVHLLLGHGDEETLLQPLRQLLQNLVLGPPQQDRRQGAGDRGEVPVTDHPAALVRMLVLGKETEHRPQAEAVDELDDRVQLLQAVLQRRARQYQGVGRRQLLHALRGAGLPVLDPLRLVEDDQVRLPATDGVQVAMHHVVVGQLVERLGGVKFRAARAETLDHQDRPGRELLDLLLPLVLERGGGDDQHPLDGSGAGEDFGGGDGLDRLAKPHVVGQQDAAGRGGKQRPLALIGIQRRLQQLLEGRAADALRECLLDPRGQLRPVPHLGNQCQGVVVAAEFMSVASRSLEELVESSEGLRPQPAVGVEIASRQRLDRRRATAARAKHHLPLRSITEEHLGVGRLKAGGQRPLAARLLLQLRQRELHVLARAQRIDGEIRTGAEVVARGIAPNGYAIGPLRLRIEDLEFGEDFLLADVLELETLLPAELPPQRRLPAGQRHVVGLSKPGELLLGCLA